MIWWVEKWELIKSYNPWGTKMKSIEVIVTYGKWEFENNKRYEYDCKWDKEVLLWKRNEFLGVKVIILKEWRVWKREFRNFGVENCNLSHYYKMNKWIIKEGESESSSREAEKKERRTRRREEKRKRKEGSIRTI